MKCSACGVKKLSDEMLTSWISCSGKNVRSHPLRCEHILAVCLQCACKSSICVTCGVTYSHYELAEIIRRYNQVGGEETWDSGSVPMKCGQQVSFSLSGDGVPECFILSKDSKTVQRQETQLYGSMSEFVRSTHVTLEKSIHKVFFLIQTNSKDEEMQNIPPFSIKSAGAKNLFTKNTQKLIATRTILIGYIKQSTNGSFFPVTIGEQAPHRDTQELLNKYCF